MKTRKRVYVSIDPSSFQYFFKNGKFKITESPIPKDAIYIGVHHDWNIDRFLICFEHKSFKPIPEGQCLPIHEGIKVEILKK